MSLASVPPLPRVRAPRQYAACLESYRGNVLDEGNSIFAFHISKNDRVRRVWLAEEVVGIKEWWWLHR